MPSKNLCVSLLFTFFMLQCAAIDDVALATGNRENEWGKWLQVGNPVSDSSVLQLDLCQYQNKPVVFYESGTTIQGKIFENETWASLPTLTPSQTFTSFDCASNTTQLILAIEYESSNGIAIFRYEGSTWTEDTPQPISSTSVNDVSISSGGTIISYTDTSDSNKSKVVQYTSGAWQTPSTVSSSLACYGNTVAVTNGVIVHACRNESDSGKLKVAKYENGSWTESTGLSDARATKIKITSYGSDMYISYILAVGNSSSRLVTGSLDGTTVTDLVMPSIITPGNYANTTDSSGNVWVGFPAAGDSGKLAVNRYQGGQWVYKGISISATNVSTVDMESIAAYTYVAYADALNSNRVLVKRYTE